MTVRSLLVALAAGVAAFIVVGAAVSEYTLRWIEFSVFVGIPAGLAAGAFVAAGVYLGLADDAPAQRRRVASAFGGFGVAFVVLLVGLAAGLGLGTVQSMVVAAVAAAVIGGGLYLRG